MARSGLRTMQLRAIEGGAVLFSAVRPAFTPRSARPATAGASASRVSGPVLLFPRLLLSAVYQPPVTP
jgi:hypothetical protein